MKRILAACSLILLGCLCIRTDSQAKILIKNAKMGAHCTGSLNDKGTLIIKGKDKAKDEGMRGFASPVKRIIVSKGITAIGEGAISYADTKEIVLPNTVHTLDGRCFDGCEKLRTIRIPPKVTLIPYAAFRDCLSLRSVKLPYGLKKVEEDAFNGCNSLERIVIPDSVTRMERHVFRNCQKLKTIVLPSDLKKADLSFDRCLALRKIKNRSSRTIKLNTVSGHRVWRVNGKRTTVLKADETAKTRGTKYRISYDLCGGKALGQLPKTRYYGEKVDIPRAEREGYEFLGWRSVDEWNFGLDFLTTYERDIKLTACFVKIKIDSQPGGILKVGLDADDISWMPGWEEWYVFRFRPVGGGQTRYSACCIPGGELDILDDLEKGREYVCDISYGLEGFEDLDEYKAWFLPRRVYIQP